MSSVRTLPNTAALAWLGVTLLFAGLAVIELNRVARGDLFLLRADFDAVASSLERHDAHVSAVQWRLPAVLTVLCCGALCYFLGRSAEAKRPASWLVVLFLLATAFDLFTTLWFFHEDGIDSELHPGVRLLGYAYGRTAGPMLAKLIQVAGILSLAVRLPRIANALLLGTAAVYTLAALYNMYA